MTVADVRAHLMAVRERRHELKWRLDIARLALAIREGRGDSSDAAPDPRIVTEATALAAGKTPSQLRAKVARRSLEYAALAADLEDATAALLKVAR